MPLLQPTDYKTDGGVVRTKSLFHEYSYDDTSFVVFTLKDTGYFLPSKSPEGEDQGSGKELLPISRLFVESTVQDPTEYSFAMEVFGSWEAWDKIRSGDRRLKAQIEKWRTEADVCRKSIAFKSVVEEAQGGKSAFSAAKYLIEETWATKGPDGRSARKKARETAEEAFERSGTAEDIKRLREEGLIQ